MLKSFLPTAVLLTCTALIGHPSVKAGQEVLFERKMTEGEARHFTLKTKEIDVSKEWKVEHWSTKKIAWLKRRYNSPWESSLMKVVYVYDDETKQPIVMRVTRREIIPAGTIYERELGKEYLERYGLDTTTWKELPDDATLEEIREEYSKSYWDQEWGIQKVEVLFRGALKGRFGKDPRFRVTRLRRRPWKTEEQKQKEAAWTAWAKAEFGLEKDQNGFSHWKTQYKFPTPEDHEYDHPIEIGRVKEFFTSEGFRDAILVEISQYPGDKIPMHEFLRWFMESGVVSNLAIVFRAERTSFGHVVMWQLPIEVRNALAPVGIMWRTGNSTIRVSTDYGTTEQLLKLYGNKFPSDLPKKLDFDLTKWHKDEVAMALPRMQKNIPGEKPVRIDWFGRNYFLIKRTVALPDGFPTKPGKDYPKVPTEKHKQELYDKLLQWWQQNKEKLEWSNKADKLDLKAD